MGKKSKRPKLSIPLSKIEVVIEAATALILLTSIAVLGQNWGLIKYKYKIPSHYGMGGPDAWTESKMFLVFLLIVIIIFYLGFTILSRFPHIFNYPKPITQENARKIYLLSRTMMTLLKLEIICILFAFEWDMVQKCFQLS
ncbi:MAG: hypothetical protein H0Z35_00325 [Thermoanaerobacteraceae bacterium]|nr:hypothetical protein [Thermoanaerobacteraceae bacterium]